MLVKLLSQSDKQLLLQFAELLALADKPLLWDGKTKEEITSDTDLEKLTFQKGEQETALLAELKTEGERTSPLFSVFKSIETKLIEKIKIFPLQTAEEPENRTQAATAILKKLLEDSTCALPSVPKLMLFELILMALCNGSISNVEWALLKEFQRHHQLEDFIFDDLLQGAETVSREIGKIISIVLE